SQPAQDVAILDQIGLLERVLIRQLGLAWTTFLILAIQFSEDSNLDRAGLREDIITMQQPFPPAGQIQNRDSKHTVKLLIDLANRGFQLVPKRILLLVGGFWLTRSRLADY